ncbi:hypothetical protein KTO58_23350 [Chitinophaga pendula]|uniref:hypothetical protein n=1 Tax=Chitinophaga TaxID=79328 RepID=UPI000BAF6005|nr:MULTISPECIES: hypothetical protein [Chitinophaga]ASZ10451.1 hypothetical protein CK934_05410 [Chitinophaga sp. MD30]UCJ06577.1 hypothetical protein KTO58_23350 [Chitinophaga pendula]
MERPAMHIVPPSEETPSFPASIRTVAQVISYVLHPLFIPTIVTFLVLQAMPEYFVTFKQESIRLPFDTLYFRVISISLVFPLLVVLLSRQLGFVSSIYLQSQRDRIIPYVGTVIFYFWAFYTFKRQGIAPPFFNAFFLGTFIAIIASFIANIYLKISMHTIGWGGVIGFLLSLMWGMHMNVTFPLIITFFVAGMVGTARLILHAHTRPEVNAGFIVGIVSQLIAYAIIG